MSFHLTKLATLAAAALLFAGITQPTFASESMNLPKANLTFVPSGIGPIELAPAMGDMTKDGLHGNYIRIPGNFASPPHIHTEDYFAVVLTGTIANGPPDATDIPLEPGSYWSQKGGENHITKCISADACTFFVVQGGKFDFLTK